MVAKEIQYRNKDEVVPCASQTYCRCPYLGDGDHNCSKCKTQVHIQCMGENNEGGGKLCAMCVSPNGLCDFAKGFAAPQAPSWYKPPEKLSSRATPTTARTKEGATNKRKAADKETEETKYNPHDSEYLLIKPTQKKAPIWKHWLCFSASDHPDFLDSAHCKYCPRIIRAGISGTGGIMKHTKNFHSEVLSEADMPASSTKTWSAKISSHFKPKPKEKTPDEIHKSWLQRVVNYVIGTFQPFSHVETKEFRDLFPPLNVKAGTPVLERGNKLCETTADVVREEVRCFGNRVKEATKFATKNEDVVATTDHWTGPSKETFTTVTIHWIDQSWKLHNGIMDFKIYRGRATGEKINDDLTKVFEYNNICPKNLTIVITDTTGSQTALGRFLREKGYEHAYCTDHNLHRNSLHAFEDKNIVGADGVMKKARALVEYFTKSNQKLDILKDRQKTMPMYSNLKKPLTILQDVRTRWWSTWRMIRRLRFLRPAIGSLIGSGEVDCENLSDAEWEILEKVQNALSEASHAQRYLEGEKYVTASLVPRCIYKIRTRYANMLDDEDVPEPVRRLVKILLKDLDERWVPLDGKVQFDKDIKRGAMNRYIHIHPYFFYAAFLDPRMKDDLHKTMTPANYFELETAILEQMIEYTSNNSNSSNDDAGDDLLQPTPDIKRPRNNPECTLFDDMASHLDRNFEDKQIKVREDCRLELSNYQREVMPLFDKDGEFNDPLEWWKSNESKFSTIAKLARKFLAIPATSAPSERIWSIAKNVLTTERACLKENVAAAYLYIQENIEIFRTYYEDVMGEPLDDRKLPKAKKPVVDVGAGNGDY